MSHAFTRSTRRVASSAPALAAAGAALLSLDDVLGFIGARALPHGWSPSVAAATLASALLGALASLWCRDTIRSLVSCAVIVQIGLLPPTGVTGGWYPLIPLVQTLVPLALVAASARPLRPSRSRRRGMLAALSAAPAAVWLAGIFAPGVPLELFLGSQTSALIVAAVLVSHEPLHRTAGVVGHLWKTAAVR